MTVSKDEMDAHWSGPTHWLEMKDAADRMQAFREAVRLACQVERERCAQAAEAYADELEATPRLGASVAHVVAARIRGLPDRESK
jgi:hypothetical protein